MKITMQEIETAIARAAPAEGEPWQAAPIARSLAKLVAGEAEQERREREAWEAGRTGWTVRFSPTGGTGGDAGSIASMQETVLARHREEVSRQLGRNRKLLSGIGASVVTLGTGALTGGVTAAALAAGALEISRLIASALNGEDGTM